MNKTLPSTYYIQYEYTYSDTLLSKNKLKKFIILNFLLRNVRNRQNFVKDSIHITLSLPLKHKNVFLQSPFHFKIVKTHLYIPTYYYSIQITCTTKTIQTLTNNFFLNFLLVGLFLKKTISTRYLYKL